MSAPTTADPEVGQLVRVRGEQWLVTEVDRSAQPSDELSPAVLPGRTMVTLANVSGDDLAEELTVVWDVEPGRAVLPASALPDVSGGLADDPERFGAFLDAVRWGTVASADTATLQAPFRSGISIETYQLSPVARALAMPRVNLLIADDVGLGKTIEAGLIAQELLLRHRARRMLVVCPAPLTVKWQEEMAEKFGLEFQILDAGAIKNLRRTYGQLANPFSVYPRMIISLQWLRTPRVQRLLDEVLTEHTRHPGFFDLLIVDEVHHCAPPAPRRASGYAVDSLQTQAVRRVGDHTAHRLFLSATPHNGYSQSWQALLEMLDAQRFTRGIDPDPAALAEVMVRRLKDDLVDEDGNQLFHGRETTAIEVSYTDSERRGYRLLVEYLAARQQATGGDRVRAGDLVALLLKKRLFSSPAAFARTLAAHVDSVSAGARNHSDLPDWLLDTMTWDDELIVDENSAQAETDFLFAVDDGATISRTATDLLNQLQDWSAGHAGPADSKATALLAALRAIRDADPDDRVIVFTEYVDTQRWLSELIDAAGLGGDRLGLLFGGIDTTVREMLKARFQAPPDRDNVRILLATDAASEGIDLQRHCHRIIHYDIPFNPNRLEQRIGRVDRHGQSKKVQVQHFVSSKWREAEAGSYDDDLEFLSRVATKVATERADLGSVNPVLAQSVEAKMLGRPIWVDPGSVKPAATSTLLRSEQQLRQQISRLRGQLETSVAQLHVAPANVRRVVQTALALADQKPLVTRPDGTIAPPDLQRGWQRTVVGLADPLTGRPRPMTFDHRAASPDVVLAHLEHPLVAQSTTLLRSAIWGTGSGLRRVAAARAEFPADAHIDDLVVAVFARLLMVGADGHRLHEEVMVTGRVIAGSGRGRRLELDQPRMTAVRQVIDTAFEPGRTRLAAPGVLDRIGGDWSRIQGWLAEDVALRAGERVASLTKDLQRRSGDEAGRVRSVFAQLRSSLERAVSPDGGYQLSFADLDEAERSQADRDRAAWGTRLAGLAAETEREVAGVTARYGTLRELVFPFAVAIIEPSLNPADFETARVEE